MFENLNLIFTILSVVASAGVAWGITKTQIKHMQAQIDAVQKTHTRDHDLLVKLDTKIDMLLDNRYKGAKK